MLVSNVTNCTNAVYVCRTTHNDGKRGQDYTAGQTAEGCEKDSVTVAEPTQRRMRLYHISGDRSV